MYKQYLYFVLYSICVFTINILTGITHVERIHAEKRAQIVRDWQAARC